ncbi:MAG TPA: hypothetical protein VHD36_19375 [Pirellulales bacterium]|nr:hypothetical protein [Pirellulales bacterium]
MPLAPVLVPKAFEDFVGESVSTTVKGPKNKVPECVMPVNVKTSNRRSTRDRAAETQGAWTSARAETLAPQAYTDPDGDKN